jgi:transposase
LEDGPDKMALLKLYQSEVFLRRRYVKEGKTVTQIADELGVSAQTIYRYLVKFGLIQNPRSWKGNK